LVANHVLSGDRHTQLHVKGENVGLHLSHEGRDVAFVRSIREVGKWREKIYES
jgi:hypothetical protein